MSYLYLFEARGRTNYIPYNLLFRGLEFLPFVVGQHELPRGGMYKRNAYEKWDRQKRKVFSFLARFGGVSNMAVSAALRLPALVHTRSNAFFLRRYLHGSSQSDNDAALVLQRGACFTKHAPYIPKCLRRARRSASQAVWTQGRLLPGAN